MLTFRAMFPFLLVCVSVMVADGVSFRVEKVGKIKTRGAAGFEHFQIDGKDYVASANFFTSSPGRNPSMKTTSVVYRVRKSKNSNKLRFKRINSLQTVGAHGVEFFTRNNESYIAIPNYYGGDSVVYRWSRSSLKFEEIQRMKSDGAGSIESFTIPAVKQGEPPRRVLGIAEFNLGIAALYVLEGAFPNERFVLWQRLLFPGVGAMATCTIGGHHLLLASSYVTKQRGWHTRSGVFYFNQKSDSFVFHHDIGTVGAHDVETLTVAGNRHFAFFSNDKDESSTYQHSELFEWRQGMVPGMGNGFLSGRFVSRQKVFTHGAHAAEFFATSVSANDSKYFLAVANLGDRKTNKYRTTSQLYAFDVEQVKLTKVQEMPTLGATDMESFSIKGTSYLIAAEEQDDDRGGDIESTVWALVEDKDGRGVEL